MISVIMCVYNGEACLHEAITSILTQTYDDFELIVVNDASRDRTREILDSLSDNRVKVVHLEQNVGPAEARNIAVQYAQGDWIAVQDSDDISEPDRLGNQITYLAQNPDLVAVGSQIRCMDPKEQNVNEILKKNIEHHFNSLLTREKIKEMTFRGCPLCHGSVMFSKAAFLRAGGYQPQLRLCEDYDLWVRLLNIGPIDIVPKVLYRYRVSPGSASHQNWIKTCNEIMRISLRSIVQFRYAAKANPRFLVIGSAKGCDHFKRNVLSADIPVKLKGFIIDSEKVVIPNAVLLFKQSKIDGILVLDSKHAWHVIEFLKNNGFTINKNIFNLQNSIW
jgi:glycosyltransferase involved in cell wall biosynthesis